MKEIKCDKCGDLMTKWLVEYNTKLYNKDVSIKHLNGYACSNPSCDNRVISKEMEPYIKNQLIAEKLIILEKENIKKLYISNLGEIRLQRNLLQKQLGNALGVTEQRYGMIERNSNIPTFTTSKFLADILDVSTDDILKLVYVTDEFYQKIIHLELVYYDDGTYEFKHIEELKKQRELVNELRNEIRNLNMEKRKYRVEMKRGNITKEEFRKEEERINKQKKEVQIIKDGKNKRGGEEAKLLELESKHNLVVKQGELIDSRDWEIIKKHFKNDLVTIF